MAVAQQVGNLVELTEDCFTAQAAAEMVIPFTEQVRGLFYALNFFHADVAERAWNWLLALGREPLFDAFNKRCAHCQSGDGSCGLPPVQHQVPPGESADGLDCPGGHPAVQVTLTG